MITKNNILKMVRNIVKRDEGIPDRQIMHPERDWVIGLCVTFVLFTVSIGYSGYEFWVHLKKADDLITVESTIIQYKQDTVGEVLERYGSRENRFESLRNDRSNSVSATANDDSEENAEESQTENEASPAEEDEDDNL